MLKDWPYWEFPPIGKVKTGDRSQLSGEIQAFFPYFSIREIQLKSFQSNHTVR